MSYHRTGSATYWWGVAQQRARDIEELRREVEEANARAEKAERGGRYRLGIDWQSFPPPEEPAKECACKSAVWRKDHGYARQWLVKALPRQYWVNPGYPCPLGCGCPLPPKPTEHMIIEECAAECPDWWFADDDAYGWRVYDRFSDKLRGLPMAVSCVYFRTCLEAWQFATNKFRKDSK